MRSSRHWVAVSPSRSWRSCRARSSQANGFDKVIGHARRLPVRGETNRVLPRFEPLHGTASGGVTSQSSRRLSQSGPIRLPSGQPAQQFAGLASRQLFDFANSEFDRAHGGQVSLEIRLEQAGYVFIGRLGTGCRRPPRTRRAQIIRARYRAAVLRGGYLNMPWPRQLSNFSL